MQPYDEFYIPREKTEDGLLAVVVQSCQTRGNKGGYRGGEVKDLYVQGIERNLSRFEQAVRRQRYDNPTVERSVNSTLATILGREAGRRNARITWEELIAENRRIEPDLTGLKA